MIVIVVSVGTLQSDTGNNGCIREQLRAPATYLGAPGCTSYMPWRAKNMSGNPCDMSRSSTNRSSTVWEKQHSLWKCCRCTWKSSLLHIVQQSMYLMYSFILLIYISIHQCIYIATRLHTVYLAWLQALIESNLRCGWKWPSRELRDILPGCDWASLKMHLGAVIEHIWRYIWRRWSSELRDALWDRDRMRLEIHMEAII